MKLLSLLFILISTHLAISQVESDATALSGEFFTAPRPDFFFTETEFARSPVTKSGLKNQFFFINKKAFRGVYYDNNGRQILVWTKKESKLSSKPASVKFTIYEEDIAEINVSLYSQIQDDLIVVCTTDDLGFNGTYETIATEGDKVISYRGYVKLHGSQRKFAMNEVPLIDVDFFLEKSDTLTYHYVDSRRVQNPKVPISNYYIFTNRLPNTEENQDYFEQKFNFSGLRYDLDVKVVKYDTKTVIHREKNFFATYQTFDPIRKLINTSTQDLIEETYDSQSRIVLSLGLKEALHYNYIGPMTEIREVYIFNKKGVAKLRETIEVRNTYY